MSLTKKVAELRCQLRLEKLNAHMNPSRAQREIKRLQWEIEKIPAAVLNHDLDEQIRTLWSTKYESQVVQLTDGYVDLEDLPPVLEGGGFDGQRLDSIESADPAALKALEDAINEAE